MKYISYFLNGIPVRIEYSPKNEQLAKAEADNGTIVIGEDSTPKENSIQNDIDQMLIDHEYRLTLLELDLLESEV